MACFEKTRRPSASTSNCDRAPGVAFVSMSSSCEISAARLAARVSYPLQVGQYRISTLMRALYL